MARSVTEGWSHDEGRGGRSVSGVKWGHKTRVQLGAWKCNEWAKKLMGGDIWLLRLLQCNVWHLNMASWFTTVYSGHLGVNYKKKSSTRS